jgi:choline dehydrogenase-like flavoprotein
MASIDTSSLADLRQQYDYIVIGGGTSGLVVANRLTENPAVSVLFLEAGGNRVMIHGSRLLVSPQVPTSTRSSIGASPVHPRYINIDFRDTKPSHIFHWYFTSTDDPVYIENLEWTMPR